MTLTVADLVAHLDRRIPFWWAEPWDGVGLLVGDPTAPLERVFVSLDCTAASLDRAIAADAQVLLTHHPAFLDPIARVTAGHGAGGLAFAAAQAGVALVSCHTNLDRAPEGADALPAVLGLRSIAPLEDPAAREGAPGADAPAMGRLCESPECGGLRELATIVGEKLGVRPRVWGDPDSVVGLVAVAPGSGRSLVPFALSARASVMVTGELRYHEAHEAAGKGLSIVEAGHDATEWPLTRSLAAIAAATPGLPDGAVVFDRATRSWWTA